VTTTPTERVVVDHLDGVQVDVGGRVSGPTPGMAQFSPAHLLSLVMQTLDVRYGIDATVDPTTVGPAVDAAAVLLRALGVEPSASALPSRRDLPPRGDRR